MSVTVIYLAWAGAGHEPLSRFGASLRAHPAGLEHTLLVAWKGFGSEASRRQARRDLGSLAFEEQIVSPDGLDLSAYAELAASLPDRTLCFLNTSSEVLADQWLAHMAHALARPGVGIVGASASFESALSSAPRPLRPLRRQFRPFPNPHLRSNGFMLEQRLMRELRWPATSSKRAAWVLESGSGGITAQVRARGLTPLVVGRGGMVFEEDDWPTSATFRSGEQDNLLIADNRTRDYAAASPEQRAVLRRMAWGDLAG